MKLLFLTFLICNVLCDIPAKLTLHTLLYRAINMRQYQVLYVRHLDTSHGLVRALKWFLKRQIEKRMMRSPNLTTRIRRKNIRYLNLRYGSGLLQT